MKGKGVVVRGRGELTVVVYEMVGMSGPGP